jgi:hypothetical protein
MNFNARIVNADQVECSMEITMDLGHWKQLSDQLKLGHPSSTLAIEISKLIGQIEQHFYGSKDG